MATLLSISAWVKFSVFPKKWPFPPSKGIHIGFFISNSKFQPDWTKDKGARISTWNNTKNCLMTSYLPHSDDVSKGFMAFERFCPRVPPC